MTIALLALVLLAKTSGAQTGAGRASPSQDTAARRRPIESSDIAAWRTIRSRGELSRDGKWFGYVLSPNEGNDELIIRSTISGEEMRFPVGEYGGRFAFSADNRWLLYMVAPSREAAQQLRLAGHATRNTMVVLELSTRKRVEIDSIQSFTLDGERSRTLALEPYAAPANDTSTVRGTGRDLILYDLVAATKRTLPNVRDFAFDATGHWLAWTVDARAQVGNGLHVRDMQTGRDHALDVDRAFYRGLTWADRSSDRLAVLKGVADTVRADTLYTLLWYAGISRRAPRGDRFDPRQSRTVPAGMTISTTESLRWAEDHSAIFFGIRPVRERPFANETAPQPEDKVDLVLWHWNEPQLQSQQQRERARDDATFLSVYHLRDKRFVRLADDGLRDVDVAPRGRWALGWDASAYATDNSMTGRRHADLYAVDVRTGARRLLAKRFLLVFGNAGRTKRYFLSPDGVHVLTWANGAYTAHNMANGDSHLLVRQGGPTFGNQPYDYSPHKAPIEPIAWSKDGAVVVLSDRWDLWAVPINSGAPLNLTVNGRTDGINYADVVSSLMDTKCVVGCDYPTIDLSTPWYVQAYARWRKETGFVRINGGTPGAHPVFWDEALLDWPTKARDADVVAFRRGTAIEFPDYYLTDLAFSTPRRITEANPQQRELLWPSGVMLVDYTGPSGGRLQASLLLPANYQKGKRYPAITIIYERESFRRNYYAAPAEWGGGGGEGFGIDAVRYASRGYVIIYPDIDYVQDRPGTSALHCVLAAARAAVAAGVVDSTRVGLAGHSWGGYQSAFIATQTSFFRAVLTAAGLTNMVSRYGGISGSGAMETAQVESDQMRLTKPYWRDLQSYIRESAVFHVDQVTTPILLVHNDKDDAVDWRQGIEFYNAMRRAKKPIVMLQYVGQGHSTGGTANVKDLSRRAREFFDHFLMGAPAPRWWTVGVPYREMAEHLRERGQ